MSDFSEFYDLQKNTSKSIADLLKQSTKTVNDSLRSTNELKRIVEEIKQSVEPKVSQISDNVNKEKLEGYTSRLGVLGKSILDSIPSKTKNISVQIKRVLPNNKCDHELVYLETEVEPFGFKSQTMRDLSSKVCVCKCLNCGKELIGSRETLSIIECDNYTKACAVYKYYKVQGFSKDEIKSKIEEKLCSETKLIL